MKALFIARWLSGVLIALLALSNTVLAHSPTEEALEKFISEGVWEQKVENLRSFESRLQAIAGEKIELQRERFSVRMEAASADSQVVSRVIVILVDFPDFRYDSPSYPIPISEGGGTQDCYIAGTQAMFDSLLFSVNGVDPVHNPTGSLTDFYLENSYGKFMIVGDIYGWYTMPQNYSSYVGDNDGLSGGAVLATHAVDAAEAAGVNFSLYADEDNQVPVMVVHAGPGAEAGAYGIWSHRSVMSPSRVYDGVMISDYAMDPEEYAQGLSTIGVFCHEWGHVLSLPDLYDIDYNPGSQGLGVYSVMSGGSWSGGGRKPTQFDAYSKWRLGFSGVHWLTENLTDVEFPQVETNPVIYGLQKNGNPALMEAWFVENRQRVGFDSLLPAEGLFIYHVDFTVYAQNNPYRYKVAVEQADGLNSLAFGWSSGDAGDAWPGSTNNREFGDFTVPNAHTNADDSPSKIGVWDISDSDSLMYANLDIEYSHPYVVLEGDSITMSDPAPGGDGDGVFIQGETVEMNIEVRSLAGGGFNPVAILTIDRQEIEILDGEVPFHAPLNPIFSQHTLVPLVFHIPEDFEASITEFTIEIVSDSQYFPGGDRTFRDTIQFQQVLGETRILLVDDDGGYSDQLGLLSNFDRMKLIIDQWDKNTMGPPTAEELSDYRTVFWTTGNPTRECQITAGDVAVMKGYLDAGGNLALVSSVAPAHLQELDSVFMADYLHANIVDVFTANNFRGFPEHPIGGGIRYSTILGNISFPVLEPTGGGHEAFVITDFSGEYEAGTCGVTYRDGNYISLLLGAPFEYLKDNGMGIGIAPKDTLINRILSSFSSQDINCCIGIRGNADCDPTDLVDGSDLTVLINHLFITYDPLCCEAEAELDGYPGIDAVDLTIMINHLFITYEPLPECPW
ncbi:MAG: hypothetical protein DRP45_09670 [Candidatus Zixiibacteriota bacterium]|nr:MAG: hypothetical protein DRP45_09670 [candidate division Zixibacteria bacterium]